MLSPLLGAEFSRRWLILRDGALVGCKGGKLCFDAAPLALVFERDRLCTVLLGGMHPDNASFGPCISVLPRKGDCIWVRLYEVRAASVSTLLHCSLCAVHRSAGSFLGSFSGKVDVLDELGALPSLTDSLDAAWSILKVPELPVWPNLVNVLHHGQFLTCSSGCTKCVLNIEHLVQFDHYCTFCSAWYQHRFWAVCSLVILANCLISWDTAVLLRDQEASEVLLSSKHTW